MTNNSFTLTINNVDVAFNLDWDSCDGEGWKFFVLITVKGEVSRQCDSIRTSNPSASDIQSSLAYLDKPVWPSDVLPLPQIGNVDCATLISICKRINDIAIQSAPTCSAEESYYGE